MSLYPAKPKVLCLSGTVPGEPGVGGVILRDLQHAIGPGTLDFLPMVTPAGLQHGWLDQASDVSGHVVRRYETGWRPTKGVLGEALAWSAARATFTGHCRNIVRQVCQHPSAQATDKIWAVLDCPTVIHTAVAVARRLGKPLVLLVWDAPELLVQGLQLDRWSAATLLRKFGEAIRYAEAVGVIGEPMRDAYERQFGPNHYVILRHGIDQACWRDPTDSPIRAKMTIGFAGSITAQEPFRRLIATLDANQWTVDGCAVTLRLIGSRYTLDSRLPQRIEYFGWRSLEDTVELLSQCDLLYLPQPFESNLRPLAELSFPTKLTTYIAAGRRVLLHAPDYASVVPFVHQYPLGSVCHSLNLKMIADALVDLRQIPSSSINSAIAAARTDEFNRQVFVRRFEQLIGVERRAQSIEAASSLAELT